MSDLYKMWRTSRIIYEISSLINIIVICWLWLNGFELAFWICLVLSILEAISGALRHRNIEKRMYEKENIKGDER